MMDRAKLEELVQRAEGAGFSHAGILDASTLWVRQEVRDMCRADKCHLYNRSWMCPPACGSLEENREKILKYRFGIIVQTTGELEDDYDVETMMEAGSQQKKRFFSFRRELLAEYPELLALSSGGCELCEKCSYPDAPCRFPKDAMPSMEAFGLVVSDVCTSNGVGYYYGPKTITYTGCYLLY